LLETHRDKDFVWSNKKMVKVKSYPFQWALF
jgi:hypothetical protein